MKRDDVLLQCAYANALISGFGPAFSDDHRQASAIQALCAPVDIARIGTLRPPAGRRMPNIFFRGQLLELMRQAAQACDPAPGTGADFVDPEARSRFLAAALIAGDLWNRRIYADRLSGEPEIDEARKRALGAFRKDANGRKSPPLIPGPSAHRRRGGGATSASGRSGQFAKPSANGRSLRALPPFGHQAFDFDQ